MGDITWSQDLEIVDLERKPNDYLYQIIEELIERTGGESVATERLVQVQERVTSGNTDSIYAISADAVNGRITQFVLTNNTAVASTASVEIAPNGSSSTSTVIYDDAPLAANETLVLDGMVGLILDTDDEIIVSSAASDTNINISITEFI